MCLKLKFFFTIYNSHSNGFTHFLLASINTFKNCIDVIYILMADSRWANYEIKLFEKVRVKFYRKRESAKEKIIEYKRTGQSYCSSVST